jgi:hypothetical protein
MAKEFTIEDLRVLADLAGLNLSDDDLQRLLPGVKRAQQQVAVLRAIIAPGDEPTGVFMAADGDRK